MWANKASSLVGATPPFSTAVTLVHDPAILLPRIFFIVFFIILGGLSMHLFGILGTEMAYFGS